jgi:delta-aminolevulinic acid dehydratase/porphobilinogen synthase
MNVAERLALIRRPRRLRSSAAMRGMVRETRINRDGLVQPLFVTEGSDVVQPISSMPGVSRFSVDTVVRECRELAAAGVRSVLLFGIPDFKDAIASSNYDPNGVVQRAPSRRRCPSCWSSRTSVTASTPITATAGSSTNAATSTTTAAWNCW